jgi:hypothetical protein
MGKAQSGISQRQNLINLKLEVTSIGPQATIKTDTYRSQVQQNTVRCATKNAQFHQRFKTV